MLSIAIPGLAPLAAQDFGLRPTRPSRASLPDHAQLLLHQVNRNAIITLRDGSPLRGEILDADGSEITLLLDGGSLMEARAGISWAQVREVRIERKPRIIEGLLLGTAGGALLGVLSTDDETKRELFGVEAPEQMWDSALQGALIGAVAGLIRGMDVVLAPTPPTYNATGLYRPDTSMIRPTVRVINTAPTSSMTYRDIEKSLQAGPLGSHPMQADNSWNGQIGSALAIETSWPAGGRWWVRNRTEWTSLARIGLPATFSVGGTVSTELWRKYSAIRSLVGAVYTIGSPGRLPLAEIGVMGGLSRTTLKSRGRYNESSGTGPPDPFDTRSEQKVYRPLLMASGSIALVRQPKLAIALRAEGVMGPGFNANALISNAGAVIIPKHRITPIGLSIGIEILFPNF